MIITLIIAIVTFALLTKAIFETIWGLCLAIYGVVMLFVVAPALDLAAYIVRKLEKKSPKLPKKCGVGSVIAMHIQGAK